MRTIKSFNESFSNDKYPIYCRIYTIDGKYNISDLYYDIERIDEFDIEYKLFYDNDNDNGGIRFHIYLFPDSEYKFRVIVSEYIGNFYESSITDETLGKYKNIEIIKKIKKVNIANLDDIKILANTNKFNI